MTVRDELECHCPCHADGRETVHIVACCFPCQTCGFRARFAFEDCPKCSIQPPRFEHDSPFDATVFVGRKDSGQTFEAGPLLKAMIHGDGERARYVTSVCSDGAFNPNLHELCSGRCVIDTSVGWHEYHYTACQCSCHKPKGIT